jgi:hypothetical protein
MAGILHFDMVPDENDLSASRLGRENLQEYLNEFPV